MNRYVITGGPCSGKTTVIEILSSRGYHVVAESARKVIEREVVKDSDTLPWKDPFLFQYAVAYMQIRAELYLGSRTTFLDRGLMDGYGYSILQKNEVPDIIHRFGRNRYQKIFLLEALPFYINDSERKEDEVFARAVHEEIRKAYIMFEYEIIEVPLLPPEERADFIERKL